MADRDDPKLSLSPLSERKAAPPAAAGEDPLMELVRIMSGESIVDPTPATGGETVPAIGAVGSDAAPANDLETKLLTDLEALSSAFYLHPPPAPSAPPARPATPSPKPAATDSQPKPQLAASAAPMPAAPPVAAAPVAHAEKPDLRPERPAIAVPPRSEERAQAVSLLRYKRQAPGASSGRRAAVRAPAASAPGRRQRKSQNSPVPCCDYDRLFISALPRLHPPGRAVTGRTVPVKSPPPLRPTQAALPRPRIEGTPLPWPKAAEPQKDELPKMVTSGGSAPAEEQGRSAREPSTR